MHPVVIKYVQLVCIAFLFDNISCDNLSLEASRHDSWLNREASCMAVCMEKNLTAVLIDCHGKCQTIKRETSSIPTFSNETIRLICHDSDSLTIQVGYDDLRNSNEINVTNSRKFHGNLYMIRLQESKREIPQKIVYIADTPIITIGNLTNNTEYNITASIFTGDLNHRHLPTMEKFKTLSNDTYIPAPIPVDAITVEYIFKNDSLKPSTLIRWKSDDLVCKYWFGVFDKTSRLNKKFPFYKILNEPGQFYRSKIDHIEFNNEYQVRIHGVNTKYDIDGIAANYNFTTPKCHTFYKSNSTLCPPLEPKNLRTSHVLTNQHSYYKIFVEWDLPDFLPDVYNVSLYFENSPEISRNVSGAEINATFDGVHTKDSSYDVFVAAISTGGTEVAFLHNANLSYTEILDRYQAVIRIAKFVIPVLMLFIIFLITLNFKYRPKLSAKEIILRKMARSHNKDSMEVIPTDVEIQGVIGEGEFGIVKKGILKPFNKPVAVKMLKENASTDDVEGFLREITLMKSVRKHVNIVGIVGHCTSDYENMMLLTEYCRSGNLLEYLRYFQKTGKIEHINSLTAIETEFIPKCKMGSYDSFFENISTKSDKIQMNVFSNKSESLNRKGEMKTINSVMNRLYDEFGTKMKCVESFSCENERNEMYVETKFNNDNSNMELIQKLSKPPLLVENQCYDFFQSPQHFTSAQSENCKDAKNVDADFDSDTLCAEDLLRFAKQIAVGMEYLSNCKIVHRDLAARNVLVCADKTVKIADFGLSRDIYVDDVYMKASTGRLPIKWLALESMAKQEYTTKSDVWSFGILCYEIVTLGDTPYPDVSADELLEHLKNGKRLKKPDTCSDEFYQMMFTCWNDDPKLRPTFAELAQDINRFITESKEFGTLVINVLNRKQSLDQTNSSSTAYLHPISDIN